MIKNNNKKTYIWANIKIDGTPHMITVEILNVKIIF